MSSRVAKAGATKFKPVRPAPKKPPNPAAVSATPRTAPSASPAPAPSAPSAASHAPSSSQATTSDAPSSQPQPSQAALDAYAEDNNDDYPSPYDTGTQSSAVPDLSFTQSSSITATQDGPASPGQQQSQVAEPDPAPAAAPAKSKGTSFSFSSSLDAFEASHGGSNGNNEDIADGSSTTAKKQAGTAITPSLPPGETSENMPSPSKRKASPFKTPAPPAKKQKSKETSSTSTSARRSATPVTGSTTTGDVAEPSAPASPSRNIDPSLLASQAPADEDNEMSVSVPPNDNDEDLGYQTGDASTSTNGQSALPPLPPGGSFNPSLLDEIRAQIDDADAQQAATQSNNDNDEADGGDIAVPSEEAAPAVIQEKGKKGKKATSEKKGKGKRKAQTEEDGDEAENGEEGEAAPPKKKRQRGKAAKKKSKDIPVTEGDDQPEEEGEGGEAGEEDAPPPKKKRAKKIKDPNAPEKPKKPREKKGDSETVGVNGEEAALPKRKRGRPKKVVNQEGDEASLIMLLENNDDIPVPRIDGPLTVSNILATLGLPPPSTLVWDRAQNISVTSGRRRPGNNDEDEENQPPGNGDGEGEEEADQGIFPDDPLAPLDPSRVPLQALIKDINRGSISNWMAQKLEKKAERKQKLKAARDRMKLQVSLEKEGLSPEEIRKRLEEDFPGQEGEEVVVSTRRQVTPREEEDEEEEGVQNDNDGETTINHDIDLSQYNFGDGDDLLDGNNIGEEQQAEDGAEEEQEQEEREQTGVPDADEEEEEEGFMESHYGPQIKMVNGEMVIDEESTQIQRDTNHMDGYEVVEMNNRDKRVTSYTHGRAEKRKLVRQEAGQRSGRWTVADTELFYEGLSQFGTDFELIAGMFQYRDRRQIKSKWVREEKAFPERIDAALRVKKKVNLEFYEEVNKIDLTNGEIPADPMHRYYEGLPTLEEAIKLESNRAGSNEPEWPRKKEESNRPMEGEEGGEEGAEGEDGAEGAEGEEGEEGGEGGEGEEEEEVEVDASNRPLFNPDSDEEAGEGEGEEGAEEEEEQPQEEEAAPFDFSSMGAVQIKSTA